MKIAIAQLNPIIGDLNGNAQQILVAAQQAEKQSVRLLLTPELSLCGYPPRDLLLDPSFVAQMGATLQQLAEELPAQMAVLVGCVRLNERSLCVGGKPLHNSVALLQHGKIQQIFHKRLLPTYDVFDEYRYFEPGLEANALVLEEFSGAHSRAPLPTQYAPLKIGVTICEDLWNDEEFWGKRSYAINPIEELIQQGVDLVVNLSASPYSANKQQIREAMLQHGSMRHQIPVLYTNQVGANDDLIFDGCSVGFNRAGEMFCRARAFETDLLIVEYDEQARDLQPSKIASTPANLDEEIWQALVLGVRDYTRKCGFSKVVLGLSGGIDSSLVAAIATAALGKENVLGVLMPSPYSSEHSVQDALELGKNLGILTQTIPIGELMQGYDKTLEPLFAGTPFGIAEENIQSRIRGNLLMAVANKFGYLLLSTGNKSEMAVGYCTLYGDMNGGLAAIADVPKTRVYSICRWLNERGEERGVRSEGVNTNFRLPTPDSRLPTIPENVINKPPSAELKPGQLDQDSLPDYDTLDDILQKLIQEHQSAAQIVSAGHDAAVVDRVVQLVVKAEFKRRQAPPGLKITDRAFGTGWRMPIANKWVSRSTIPSSEVVSQASLSPSLPPR
ncbi:MAG: Glutamine-dependent NAD(+) synthetase [Chroococcidiopsis sp. SAG 2025]|uniref:NAD+ synthase n=1 Tax=Chroococcidiopsis sp. SAG 2025 TaxID=171389 RepID=UPI00293729BF|nr:NAD+ synthase [Chroococcidiopsis sp. SAG 2025]MDV2990402.1 Glutamine-dependent NAD(+) synthetase [Chroococcidiopsis sp. SAG 2025]